MSFWETGCYTSHVVVVVGWFPSKLAGLRFVHIIERFRSSWCQRCHDQKWSSLRLIDGAVGFLNHEGCDLGFVFE